ncbi:expansin-B6-like [Salvia splendens]|uniref:expansin-B6-like n=1 Tax=Salvia splendens TaxID=180675 RepID=UPI001C2624ED|nr:expansin-B6-like [Salvia splendens]
MTVENVNGDVNTTSRNSFSEAIATWYGAPTGAGSDGGACGFVRDIESHPYHGFVSAGNNKLYKSGAGCGTCYEVKCRYNKACSQRAIKVTITDECPGSCNDDGIHFDLSGKAFGALAYSGQEDNLRNAGKIMVKYRRVKCNYKSNIKFRIDSGSNPFYLAFVVGNLNGYGDVAHVELKPSNSDWVPMQRSWGVTWKADLKDSQKGPFSIRINGSINTASIIAYNVIPYNWKAGQYYYSSVNF